MANFASVLAAVLGSLDDESETPLADGGEFEKG